MDSDPDAAQIIMQLLFLVFLTAINAFFAGAEMAVVSVNKNRIKRLAADGSKKAVLIQDLFQNDSTRFLSTIQVAITFANFFSSASAASGIANVLGNQLKRTGLPFSETLAMIIVTIILSFITLIFGELVPKRIALQKAEEFSLRTVGPIYAISKIMAPFIKLLSVSTNLVLKLMGMRTGDIEEKVSEEEIKALMESGKEQGVFDESEEEMIASVFSFDDKIAKDAMVPRKDVYAIDIEEPLECYVDELIEKRYSRVPVYRDNIDNIIGVLNMKDFIKEAKRISSFTSVDIEKIMLSPFFVPETKGTNGLFRELQKKKNHIAILIDEYGGFSGIVTVENLVEEVMGEINNENEQQEPELVQLDDSTYLADGGILIDELNDKLNISLEPKNYDTLSGYVIENLGYIPERQDHPKLWAGNICLSVEEMADKAIHKVRIRQVEVLDEELKEGA